RSTGQAPTTGATAVACPPTRETVAAAPRPTAAGTSRPVIPVRTAARPRSGSRWKAPGTAGTPPPAVAEPAGARPPQRRRRRPAALTVAAGTPAPSDSYRSPPRPPAAPPPTPRRAAPSAAATVGPGRHTTAQ